MRWAREHYKRRRQFKTFPTPDAWECPAAKVAFASERVAKENIPIYSRQHGKPFRAYRCPHCGKWHLTSQV